MTVLRFHVEPTPQPSYPADSCDQVILSGANCAHGLEALCHGRFKKQRCTHLLAVLRILLSSSDRDDTERRHD